jgi:type I restriction enzyme S subunit
MTGASIPLRLHELLTPAQPWEAVEAVDVDCYDTDGFATGEPILRASTALGPGAHRVQAGDVLLFAGSRGPRRAWVVGEARGRAQIAAADWHVLRSDAVATGYLRHLLVSDDFQQKCRGLSPRRPRSRSKSNVDLPEVAWVVPSIDRQRRIGQVLDHVDALRTKRARVRRDASDFAQSFFAELFGSNPRWAHASVSLSELLIEAPRRGVDVELHARGSFPVLRPADLREGRLSLADARYVSHSDATLARSALTDSDVVLACDPARNDVRCAIARPGFGVWFMHAKLWRLRVDPQQLLPEYLHAWLNAAPGRSELLRAWVAERRVGVEARLGRIQVPRPPIERQRAFADGLNAVDRLEARLHASAERLDELLGTLRNLAFRGELALL